MKHEHWPHGVRAVLWVPQVAPLRTISISLAQIVFCCSCSTSISVDLTDTMGLPGGSSPVFDDAQPDLAPTALRPDIMRWGLLSGAELESPRTDMLYNAELAVPIGDQPAALEGVWVGLMEDYQFASSSSRSLRLSVDSNGDGNLVFGDGPGPPPVRRSDENYPPGHFDYSKLDIGPNNYVDGEFIGGVYEGFLYPLRRTKSAVELGFRLGFPAPVSLRAASGDLFASWCALQKIDPEHWGGAGCQLAATYEPTSTRGQCVFYEETWSAGSSQPAILGFKPCSFQEKCVMNCDCDLVGCAGRNYFMRGNRDLDRSSTQDIYFDGQLEDDSLVGWIRFPDPPLGRDRIVTPVRLTRAVVIR